MEDNHSDNSIYNSFNMIFAIYRRIDMLMMEVNRRQLMADMNGWYSCLRTLYMECYFVFEEEERSVLEKLFKKSESDFNGTNKVHPTMMNYKQWKLRLSCEEIQKQLSVYMDKHKLLRPKFQLKDGLDGLYKDFGISK